jgi:hypothetical protein
MRIKALGMPNGDFAFMKRPEHCAVKVKVRNVTALKILFKPNSDVFQSTHPFRISPRRNPSISGGSAA